MHYIYRQGDFQSFSSAVYLSNLPVRLCQKASFEIFKTFLENNWKFSCLCKFAILLKSFKLMKLVILFSDDTFNSVIFLKLCHILQLIMSSAQLNLKKGINHFK